MIRKIILVLVAALFAGFFTGCMTTPEGGQIGVVRNGGPLDNKNIRQIVCNGSGNTWTGWMSSVNYYPDTSQQRIYKLQSKVDEPNNRAKGADAAAPIVRTKDGVNAQITGTLYLTTAFDCTKEGQELLKKFDQQFIGRSDGDNPAEDWSGFLNSIIQPIIDSNMREVLATFDCKQLVSSCALVQRNGEAVSTSELAKNTSSNIATIEARVNEGLITQLKQQLGADYFRNLKFNLQAVDLPEVDTAIGEAQAAFAEVSKQQAEVQKSRVLVDKARQERLANQERQKGYNACGVCAEIEKIQALPKNLQVLGGNAVSVLK